MGLLKLKIYLCQFRKKEKIYYYLKYSLQVDKKNDSDM